MLRKKGIEIFQKKSIIFLLFIYYVFMGNTVMQYSPHSKEYAGLIPTLCV